MKNDKIALEAEEQLAKQIYEIIEHFKQEDPVGLPVVPLTDPTDVPDVDQSISMANLQMRNAKLSGISKFRIKYITTEVKEMEAKCGIFFDSLLLTGDYSLRSFVSRSKGLFSFSSLHFNQNFLFKALSQSTSRTFLLKEMHQLPLSVTER